MRRGDALHAPLLPLFHSTSHEALAVVGGRATLELGGPQGQAFAVAAGDVLVLPAGTGHRRSGAGGLDLCDGEE